MVNRRSGRVTEARGAVWIPLITFALVLAVAVGAYRLGQLNRFICDGPCGAEYVTAPDALGELYITMLSGAIHRIVAN